MKKPSLLKEEILHYLNEEWNDYIAVHKYGMWLTTRALQLKLKERGVITTWPTLSIRLNNLFKDGSIDKIKTSNGFCWKPKEGIK